MNVKELVKFDITEAAIEKIKADYMPLMINGLDDREGYQAVHDARIIVKGKRVAIEKRRKELKEDSLAFGRAIDAEAKRITSHLTPIESYLESLEVAIDQEKEHIKKEKEALEQSKLQERVDECRKVNLDLPLVVLKALSDFDYALAIEEAKDKFEIAQEAEKKRIAEEEESKRLQKIQLDRIAAEQAEIARIQAEKERELRAKQDAIDAENKRIKDEKMDKQRFAAEQAELDQIKKDAEIKAIADERARAQKELDDKAEAELKAKEEKEKIESERPDREKLIRFAEGLKAITFPTVKSEAAQKIASSAEEHFRGVILFISQQAKKLGEVN